MTASDLIHRLRDRLTADPFSRDIMGNRFRTSPPASPAAVARAEAALGFALPTTLRAIYLDVANGGFGPGYGVMGVEGGFTDDQKMTVVERYRAFLAPDPSDPEWQWQATWLPFCHWGCGIYSIVDAGERNPVFFIDPGSKDIGAPMSSIVLPHKDTLDAWLDDWMNGRDLWAEAWG